MRLSSVLEERTLEPPSAADEMEIRMSIFFERLGELEEKDQAHVSPPLRFSLDTLRGNLNSSNSAFPNYRSGGHKLLMLFTDGLDEWPHAVMEEELHNRHGDIVSSNRHSCLTLRTGLFPPCSLDTAPFRSVCLASPWDTAPVSSRYCTGWRVGRLPNIQKTHHELPVIDSIMDVKPQSRSFLDHLSIALGRSLEATPIDARRISWTKLYMEVQGLGPTITLSLPIVTKPDGVWFGQRIAELTERLPKSEQFYGIIVDNNGIVVYHPKLILPATEVHAVRRSACYDASQVRHRAGAGLRVQYGFSDQRVYRLVGLIDSIPTIDLLELEGNSTGVNRLRHDVISTTCNSAIIVDGDREYYCANLKGSPYSVIIVSSRNRQTLTFSDAAPDLHISTNPFVAYYLSSRWESPNLVRSICSWKLDPMPPSSRFGALPTIGCEDDLRLLNSLTSALKMWADSWPEYDNSANISCEDLPLPQDFDPQYFINAFVHTRSQTQAYFPSCSKAYMKEVTAKFDTERLGKENSSDLLQFSVRNDVIVAYRSITDRLDNRLAVVGMDCLLVTRSGFVLASSTSRSPAPLARFDPQLFASLEENNLVTSESWVDAQAECMASRSAPWSSPAPSRSNIFKALIDVVTSIIGKAFWIDLYYLMSSFVAGQPSIYARVFPVPRTTLTVIRVDRACPGYRSKKKYHVQPQILKGCEKVTYFDRRPPTFYNTTVDMNEEPTSECLISDSVPDNQPTLIIVLSLAGLLYL
ncbi:unnamed protein product [Nippostrongylus brasiliensis]|uniref:VWFA domain-containing protein n=1 Tax=Nippostrongylus brasiliensis TaxID=27835 RepID=A0A0N4XWU9_NIPBR|nr:unnamed protein product [Nippostrongylus brasiliensis]